MTANESGAGAPRAPGSGMDLNAFRELTDMFGGRLEAWPDDARAEAGELMRADPAARRILIDAQTLDAVLAAEAAAAPAPSNALMERILADAASVSAEAAVASPSPASSPSATSSWSIGAWIEAAFGGVGLAAAAAAGLVVGLSSTPEAAQPDVFDDAYFELADESGAWGAEGDDWLAPSEEAEG